MEYTSVTNPVWSDASHSMVIADVVFTHLGAASVKFNASPNDIEEHGRKIYADLIAGKYGVIADSKAG